MNSQLIKTAILLILTLVTASCERATTESSQVALQLPTYKNETASSCTKCLKRIIVNVDSDAFKTIVYYRNLEKMNEPATELNSEIILEIPSGPARKIQILAVYLLPDSTMEVQYGVTKVDLLSAEPPPITINLSNLGQFKGGSIVGRYMTGVDSGPTGNIIISMNHAASGMNMDIATGEILDGWFDFFASENFPMSYRFEAGINLPEFQNITLDSIMPLTGGTAVNHLARIHRPSSYYSFQGATWNLVNEYHDIVYGFFGLAAPLKRVCIEHMSAALPFVNLASSPTGSPKLNFDEGSDTTASIYGIGGLDSVLNSVLCSNSGTSDRYRTDIISINMDQFDGKGNNTAKGIAGAFTYIVNAGNVQKYLATGSGPRLYTFKALPGLISTSIAEAKFDGVKLFQKSNAATGGFDNFKCNPLWLAVAGFNEVSNFVSLPSVAFDIVDFSLPGAPAATDGFILCPTKSGFLTGLGGFYVGSLQ